MSSHTSYPALAEQSTKNIEATHPAGNVLTGESQSSRGRHELRVALITPADESEYKVYMSLKPNAPSMDDWKKGGEIASVLQGWTTWIREDAVRTIHDLSEGSYGTQRGIEAIMTDHLTQDLALFGFGDKVSVNVTSHQSAPPVERYPRIGQSDLRYLLGDTCTDSTQVMERAKDPRTRHILHHSDTPTGFRWVGYSHLPMTHLAHKYWLHRTLPGQVEAVLPARMTHPAILSSLADTVARHMQSSGRETKDWASHKNAPIGTDVFAKHWDEWGVHYERYRETGEKWERHLHSPHTPGNNKHCQWTIDAEGTVTCVLSDIITAQLAQDAGPSSSDRKHVSAINPSSSQTLLTLKHPNKQPAKSSGSVPPSIVSRYDRAKELQEPLHPEERRLEWQIAPDQYTADGLMDSKLKPPGGEEAPWQLEDNVTQYPHGTLSGQASGPPPSAQAVPDTTSRFQPPTYSVASVPGAGWSGIGTASQAPRNRHSVLPGTQAVTDDSSAQGSSKLSQTAAAALAMSGGKDERMSVHHVLNDQTM